MVKQGSDDDEILSWNGDAFVRSASVWPSRPLACELDRPLKIAGLDYDSAAFHTAVAGAIAEKGLACKVERVPGAIAPLVNGMGRGDVDLVMEIWMANPVEAWVKEAAAGKVEPLGTTFPDANEGWFVPRCVISGPDAKAPDLKSVQDLKRYKALFADPEEPGKGSSSTTASPAGSASINTKKLAAVYGLAEDYTNTRGGSGEALVAAIESALKRNRPVLFYSGGRAGCSAPYDLVKLEEAPFDPQIWEELKTSAAPKRATAYPTSRVVIGANIELAKKGAAARRLPQELHYHQRADLEDARRGPREGRLRPSSRR